MQGLPAEQRRKEVDPPSPGDTPTSPLGRDWLQFIVKLPVSNRFESILVVVNCFTQQAHFIPCNKSTNTEELVEIFLREVWRLHGLPKRTISDRGATFNSHFLCALYSKLGIELSFSTAHHPETNGLAERTNQWLEGFLRGFCNYSQHNWAKQLPIVEFCHNNQVNLATGKTVFELLYGLHPRWDNMDTPTGVPAAKELGNHLKEL